MILNPLIEKRYSPRAFSDKPVENEKLNLLFEAARWSASSMNEQPWRFVYATKEDAGEYNLLLDTLVEWNQKWAKSAPVLVAAVAKLKYDKNQKHNEHARYDLGQSMAYLSIQATELGLYLHQMGGFSAAKAKNSLNIPDGYEVVAMVALGYKGDLSRIPEEYHADEHKKRERMPIEKMVFKGKFRS